MRPITKPHKNLEGFITTGDDKKVKLWSLDGEVWGSIDMLREKMKLVDWQFPHHDRYEKKEQMREVMKTIAEMNGLKELDAESTPCSGSEDG